MRTLQRYKVYRRLLLFYFLLILATVALLSGLLYSVFIDRNLKDTRAFTGEILAQSAQSLDAMMDQTDAIVARIISNYRSITALYAQKPNYLSNYHLTQEFNDLLAVHPFIQGISLYNGNTGYFLGRYPADRTLMAHLKAGAFKGGRVLETVRNPIRDKRFDTCLALIIDPNYLRKDSSPSAIVLFMNSEFLCKDLKSMAVNRQALFIADCDGRVLAHSDPAQFLADHSAEPFMRDVLDSKEANGSFRASYLGEDALVSYLRSERYGWSYVCTLPYAQIVEGQRRVLRLVVLFAALLTLTGCAVCLLFIRRLYRPIDRLICSLPIEADHPINEFEQLGLSVSRMSENLNLLETTVQDAYEVIRQSYYRSLLSEKPRIKKEVLQLFEPLRAEFSGACFCVIIAHPEDDASLPPEEAADRLARTEALCTSVLNASAVRDFSEEIVLIAQFASRQDEAALSNLMRQLSDRLKQEQVVLTIAIGRPCGALSGISASYLTAQNVLSMRFFAGSGSVLTEQDFLNHISPYPAYPVKLEKQIVEALHLSDEEALSTAIEALKSSLRETCLEDALACLKQLYHGVVQRIGAQADADTGDWINADRTLSDVCTEMSERFSGLQNANDAPRQAGNRQLSEAILKYIEETYADSLLSVQSVAEYFGISASHLSRLLKNYQEVSFVQHLTNVRLDQAGHLLRTTDMPISRIIEMTGINSTNYFHTLFKKRFGTTPGQYRQNFFVDSPK